METTLLTTAKSPKSAGPMRRVQQDPLHESRQHEVDLREADEHHAAPDGLRGRFGGLRRCGGAHGFTPRDDAFDAGEIAARLHVGRSRRPRSSARVASAWPSPISSASAPPGASSAGASATRRRTRSSPSAPPSSASAGSLRTSARQRRELAGRDVGQVRDDQRERRVRGQRRAQIPLDEGDRRAQPLGVRARHLQRRRRDVAGEHGGAGAQPSPA